MNPFEERENDAIQATPRDPLEALVGPMTRLKPKKFKKTSSRHNG
jgi:hypothetical protein